jgi:hypothetical protein
MHGRLFGGWNWLSQFHFGGLDGAQVSVRNVALHSVVKMNCRNLSTGINDLAEPNGISDVEDFRLLWVGGPNI